MAGHTLRPAVWWMAIPPLVVAVLAGASAQRLDRTAESYRVYDAVIEAMSSSRIQLHSRMEGRIAIVDQVAADGRGEAGLVRSQLQKTLRDVLPDTVNDYLRVRGGTQKLERRFNIRLPYDLVTRQASDQAAAAAVPGGIVTLSSVGFSRSGREALVFVTHVCGGLCATGHFVLLRAHEDCWKVERAALMWIS